MAKIEVVNLQNLPSAQTFLSAREQAFYSTLKLPKRQSEWLGGRLALKKAIAPLVGLSVFKIEVLPQENSGKPQLLLGGEKSVLPFSITHSHGYAVAAVAPEDKYVGIDLEKIAHRIEAWKTDFFHPTELASDSDAFLTALWTKKEAVVKLLGTGLSLNSFDVRCVGEKIQFFNRALQIYQSLGSPQISLKTSELINGFQFSIAVGK